MIPSNVRRLIEVATEVAQSIPDFQSVRGPGLGDHATGAYMAKIRAQAFSEFGKDYSEKRLCGPNSFAADFFFPDEATIVEIALGLPNPGSEFEKDILKALMAQEAGFPVTTLVFISRAGAVKKCAQPGRTAIIDWAAQKHGLAVEVYDLPGEPRKRRRNRRGLPPPPDE